MLSINVVNMVSVINEQIRPYSNSKENQEKSPIPLAMLGQLPTSPGLLTHFLVGSVIDLEHTTQ